MPRLNCYFWQFGLIAVVVSSAFAQAGVIVISSFDELCLIGADENYPLDGDYGLAADIDASGSRDLDGGAGFPPIGRRKVLVPSAEFGAPDIVDSAKAFTGTFDGGGHTISGLYIRRTASDAAGSGSNIGLFGFALGARISNLTVAADTVVGYRYVGALVGRQSGGVIEGCAASGAVAGEADVGGLAGAVELGGAVKVCYSAAYVGGGSVNDVGGLVGSAGNAVISESYSIGGVSVDGGQRVGGLVGALVNIASVRSCYSAAAVSGGGADEVGGLVGRNDGVIRQSYSVGPVAGDGGNVGGLIGEQGDGVGTTAHCFWDTERSGLAASAGGSGASGKTTAQMMTAADMGNLTADTASWGISNNYPYLKNEAFPRYTATVTATRGGALSGLTSAGGTAHTQRVNHWISGSPIAATPSPDSIADRFDGWYLAGSDAALADGGQYDGFAVNISDDGETLSFSDLTADVAIEARFSLKVYTLRYIAMSGRGKIESQDDNAGEYLVDTLTKRVEHGAVSSVRADQNVGRTFLEWGADPNGEKLKSPTRSDTALGDATYRAYFTTDSVVLIYTADTNGRLRVNKVYAQTHTAKPLYGSNGPLIEAVPNQDYRFVRWSDGVTDNPRIDSAATENVNAVAIFSNTYEVKYIAGVGGKIVVRSVSADTLFDPADTAAVTVTVSTPPTPAATAIAVADSGFRFVKWSDDIKDSARNDAAARRDSTVTAIFEAAVIAVKSPDRIVPGSRSIDETAQIPPMRVTAGGFAAGPNPVLRQSGAVDFYWRGAVVVNGTLSVFDAAGNFVNTISINGINKRSIAVWDLTDANGKPVGAGTYLIKGTLSTKNGKRERIALVLMLI